MLLCCAGPEGWAAHRRLWRRKRQRCSDSEEQAEGNGGPAGSAPLGRAQPGAIPLDATYEDLLGGPYRPFTQPIQLQVRGLLGCVCGWGELYSWRCRSAGTALACKPFLRQTCALRRYGHGCITSRLHQLPCIRAVLCLQEMVAFLQECWYDEGLYS